MNIRLIIPNIGNNGRSAPMADYGRRIADIGGGFTSWQGIGGWRDHQDNLVVESVTIVDVSVPQENFYHEFQSAKYAPDEFRKLAADIARELAQGCVCLSIDGVVEYIEKGD